MKHDLDVTVVIPSYNTRQTIRRAIDSVLFQTEHPKELIIIDDCSTDGTYEMLEELSSRKFPFSISIIRNTSNLGPGLSRNIGWDHAKSGWIAFLDADDAWHPQKLELQFRAIERMPDIDLICTESIIFSHLVEQQKFPLPPYFTSLNFVSSLFRNPIPTRSVVLRTNIPFRFPKGLSEDYALWLQCLDAKLTVVKLQVPLSFHFRPEFSKGGLSGDLLNHELCELRTLSKYLRKNPIQATLALTFSILKFCRRVLLRVLRKVFL